MVHKSWEQVDGPTKFCKVAPESFGPPECNLLHGTISALDFEMAATDFENLRTFVPVASHFYSFVLTHSSSFQT